MSNYNRVDFQKFLVDCLDFESGESDVRDKLLQLYATFKDEASWEVSRIGEQKALGKWLSGLPTCSNLPFMNNDILEILIQFNILKEDATERKKDELLENWWDSCASIYLKLISRAWKNYKINY